MGFNVGDRVSNDQGWHGKVEQVQPSVLQVLPDGTHHQTEILYWVRWKEREEHPEKIVQRQPVISHTKDQIHLA